MAHHAHHAFRTATDPHPDRQAPRPKRRIRSVHQRAAGLLLTKPPPFREQAGRKRSSFSLQTTDRIGQRHVEQRIAFRNEPRPRITSARPFDTAFSVENRWKTRTGSSDDSTVTAVPRWMRLVRLAIAVTVSISGGGDREIGAVVFAQPMKSTPV